jgi:hypothetical protein
MTIFQSSLEEHSLQVDQVAGRLVYSFLKFNDGHGACQPTKKEEHFACDSRWSFGSHLDVLLLLA